MSSSTSVSSVSANQGSGAGSQLRDQQVVGDSATSRAPFRTTRINPYRGLSFDPNRSIWLRTIGVSFRTEGVIFREEGIMFTNKLVDNVWAQFGLRRSAWNMSGSGGPKAKRTKKMAMNAATKASRVKEQDEEQISHAPSWVTQGKVASQFPPNDRSAWASQNEPPVQPTRRTGTSGKARKSTRAKGGSGASKKRGSAQNVSDPKSCNEYGIKLFKQGNISEAKYWFERALAFDPTYDPAQQNLKVAEEALSGQKGGDA